MSEKKKKKQNSGKFKSLMDHRILVAVLAFGLALILILSTIAPLFAYASEATEETEEAKLNRQNTKQDPASRANGWRDFASSG